MEILGWVVVGGVIAFLIWVIYTSMVYLWAPKDQERYLILLVQNQEDTIEDTIRKVLIEKRQMGEGTELIIVDINSEDKTMEIIERMAYPKNYFSVVGVKDYVELDQLLKQWSLKKPIHIRRYSNFITNI